MLGASAPLRLVALAFLAGGGLGRAPSADEAWRADCDRVKETALPPGDQPDADTRRALAGCQSEDLYYGIGQPADPSRARLCAYLERSTGDAPVFGGSAILMTIYATGIGARRNPDLAIRFACALEGAPAEMEGRIAHLEKLRASERKKMAFDSVRRHHQRLHDGGLRRARSEDRRDETHRALPREAGELDCG